MSGPQAIFARAGLAWELARRFGVGWLAYRGWYALRLRSGWLARRHPVQSWAAKPLAHFLDDSLLADEEAYFAYRQGAGPAFFFYPQQQAQFQPLFGQWVKDESAVVLAEALAQGRLRYFGQQEGQIGNPPQWARNPFTGETAPSDRHWSRISDFAFGDIKVIWEASRFGFVYALVRAYWRTRDERWAALFWQWVEDWYTHNPPQQGPNWKCGQETSLRVMAWCFGLYGFGSSRTTTPGRVAMLAQMTAVAGERIAANLRYALSQRNNHGVSEGMGLFTIGRLFPELKQARAWAATGRQVLEQLAQELIAEDGSFAQHSVNYHRLMLHDYLWCLRLAEVQDAPFSDALYQRISRAAEWLAQLQVGKQGEVPRYGQMDGALILPVNNCDFQDYRPVIQAAHFLFTGKRRYGAGAWDEDLLWLFGPEALTAGQDNVTVGDIAAPVGGYYTLRQGQNMAFVRCGRLRERPSQADMLHVDIWWRGEPVAQDAGTYSYNAPPPWNNPLAETAYHNCVTVDGQGQMARRGKFMWLPWVTGSVEAEGESADGRLAYWQGSHDGYARLRAPVAYQRGIIRLGEETWLVLDRLRAAEPHHYRLHWLLADWPLRQIKGENRLQLQMPEGAYWVQWGAAGEKLNGDIVRGDPGSPRGWYAPYYQQRQPAHSLETVAKSQATLFWTLFGAEPYQVVPTKKRL